ncbi:MAG: zinc ribbon domain-containing protein [Oscillospiraceae bacterium]|nr:zinc ribbon domain-containing protein [Oscillospiraceae bacterium]
MNCEKCGNPIADNAPFCEHCGKSPSQAAPEVVSSQKPENVITGCVGALIGAAIGGGSIILLAQLGYIAAISGLILAICTLKGYELLGGRLSTKGIIISVVLMLATPYIADRINWAIVVMDAFSDFGITFGEAFAIIPELVEEEAIEKADYIKDLVMIYAFVALGAFSTVRGLFKKK